MNEYQPDYNSDFEHQKLIEEDNSVSDTIDSYTSTSESLNDPAQSAYTYDTTWEHSNQIDHQSQPYDINENIYVSIDKSVEINNDFYSTNIIEPNYTYSQEEYSLDSSPYQYDRDPNITTYGDLNSEIHRSGHAPTSEDLKKANELDRQAEEQERQYQNNTDWGKYFEEAHNNHEASINYNKAAQNKEEAEELRAEATKLREQT